MPWFGGDPSTEQNLCLNVVTSQKCRVLYWDSFLWIIQALGASTLLDWVVVVLVLVFKLPAQSSILSGSYHHDFLSAPLLPIFDRLVKKNPKTFIQTYTEVS